MQNSTGKIPLAKFNSEDPVRSLIMENFTGKMPLGQFHSKNSTHYIPLGRSYWVLITENSAQKIPLRKFDMKKFHTGNSARKIPSGA